MSDSLQKFTFKSNVSIYIYALDWLFYASDSLRNKFMRVIKTATKWWHCIHFKFYYY